MRNWDYRAGGTASTTIYIELSPTIIYERYYYFIDTDHYVLS